MKSNIWSCGVILYAMTTGSMPWTEKVITNMFVQIRNGDYQIPPLISEKCANLLRRLIAVDCNKRITIEEALIHPFLIDIVVPVDNDKTNSNENPVENYDKANMKNSN